MTTARRKFVANKLLEKGGAINKVAARYSLAGFRVRVSPGAEGIDILAVRGEEKYGVRVLRDAKPYGPSDLASFVEACSKRGLRPVLVLYGSGPKLSPEVLGDARSKGVVVRRFRP